MDKGICPICGLDDAEETNPPGQNASVIACKRCGTYMMEGLMVKIWRSRRAERERLPLEDEKLLPYLSAYTRQKSERGETAEINKDHWRDYARQHNNTGTAQKRDWLLVLIKDRTSHEGYGTNFDCELDYPLIGAESAEGCYQLLTNLQDRGYVKIRQYIRFTYEVTILTEGREYLEEMSRQVDEITDVEVASEVAPYEYISQERLAELKALRPVNFDLRRLIRLCEEIDTNYRNDCWHAVTALTREVLDHVPPIFGYGKFEHVANNYGGRSFKGSMQHLENSLRHIANLHLHTQIRKNEILPTATQVNFANDLDVLLGEIVRILR